MSADFLKKGFNKEIFFGDRDLVRILRGRQLSVRVTFHNFRLKEQLAAYVGSKIEADSLDIIQLLENTAFLESSIWRHWRPK